MEQRIDAILDPRWLRMKKKRL